MRIRLNGELVRALIDDIGGVEPFLERWLHGTDGGEEDLSKATVYRWIKGQLPKSSSALLRLCGVLDVDPFALLKVDDRNLAEVIDQLIEIVQKSSSKPAPLQLIRNFFGRHKNWPPEGIATTYFKRSWHVQEFRHDPRVRHNLHSRIGLTCSPEGLDLRPQIVHFASRYEEWFGGRWLHYGFVSRHAALAKLSCINGFTQEIALRAVDDPTPVKFWLGPNEMIVRAASLHPFTLATDLDPDSPEPTLLFPA